MVKCALTYWLTALLHNHSHTFTLFCLVMMLLYSIVNACHVKLAWSTQLRWRSVPIWFDNCCMCTVSAKNKAFQTPKYFRCECVNLRVCSLQNTLGPTSWTLLYHTLLYTDPWKTMVGYERKVVHAYSKTVLSWSMVGLVLLGREVSLITGLEYGMEWWNRNILWNVHSCSV